MRLGSVELELLCVGVMDVSEYWLVTTREAL